MAAHSLSVIAWNGIVSKYLGTITLVFGEAALTSCTRDCTASMAGESLHREPGNCPKESAALTEDNARPA